MDTISDWNQELDEDELQQCQITISYGLLKEALKLKDNITIVDVYKNNSRPRIITLVLEGDESSCMVQIGDIRRATELRNVQRSEEKEVLK